jgi:hypothetical protein
MTISLITNLSPTEESVIAYFSNHKFINLNNSTTFTSDCFLIIDPFFVNGQYINYSSIYRQFLTKKHPSAKILIAGIWEIEHPNYIDLFKLPNDLDGKCNNAMQTDYLEEVISNGIDVREIMKHFFEGHGEFSLLSSLINLLPALNAAYIKMKHQEGDWVDVNNTLIVPFSSKGTKEFVRRWDKYQPYLEFLPFFPDLQIIERDIRQIANIDATDKCKDWFLNSQLPDRLNMAITKLRQINVEYAFSKEI